MNPNRRLLTLLLLSCGWLPARAIAARTIRITNGEWPRYLSKDLPHFGIASRIVTEAFAFQGIQAQYDFFPWRRALALADSRQWEGSALWLASDERKRRFYISDPIIHADIVFFHRKDVSFDWSYLGDLTRYRVGITNDYFYGEDLETARQRRQLPLLEEAQSDEMNFRKLLFKRIDAFPMDMLAGKALLNKRFSGDEASQITAHPKPLYAGAMYLMLSKKIPGGMELMTEFNSGLKKLRATGNFDLYLHEAESR